MQRRKVKSVIIGSIILSGAVGLITPAWSQEAPGERHQPYPNLTRPGRGEESVPGIHQGGTPELSRKDMKAVEEALQAKGYEVGRIDGVADDDARAAIRAFQQDAGIPITGMVDQRTADRLDVAISRPGSSPSDDWNNGQSERNREWDRSRSDSNMTTPGDDQSLPSHFRN